MKGSLCRALYDAFKGHLFIQDICALGVEKYILEPVLFYFLLELRSLLSLLLLLLFIFLYQYPYITPVHNVNTLPPLATSKEVRGCVVHAIKSR